MKKKNYLNISINDIYKEYEKSKNNITKRNILKKIIDNKIKLQKIEENHLKIVKEKTNITQTIENTNQINTDNPINTIDILLNEILESNMEEEKEEINNELVNKTNIEDRYIEEIDKDFKNNKLMERLNNELMFRNNVQQKEKTVEKPYFNNQKLYESYNSNNQIADINDKQVFGLSGNNFTSESILKERF